MRTRLGPLTSAHFLLFLLSIISLAGVLVGVILVDGWIARGAVVLTSVLVLILGAQAAIPAETQRQRTIRYVAFVFAGLLPLLVVGRPLIDAVALAALDAYWPSGAQAVRTELRHAPVALVMLVAFLMYAVTLWTLRHQAALGRTATDPHLREAGYPER